MATSAEQLILRGLNLVIRASFSPNDPAAQAKHFVGLQADIGPWLTDYAEEIAKPARRGYDGGPDASREYDSNGLVIPRETSNG